MFRYTYLLLICTLLLAGCKSDPKPGQSAAIVPTGTVTIPGVDRDSALHFVQTQLNFGPRTMGSGGHEACKEWIIQKLKQYGAVVTEQDFQAELYTGESFDATNIIGKINPSQSRRILLAAHWDTRMIAEKDPEVTMRDSAIAGADDGASGVAVLLEIARTIKNNPIDLGIDFVFFDAEDQGDNNGQSDTWCLGAQYWAKNLSARNRAEYGILLDMVGAKGATFRKEEVSVHYANAVVEKVWSLGQSMGYGHYFVNERIAGLTDDHLFVNQIAGLPMIDIINHTGTAFGEYHHTHADDIGIIDRNTLRAVGQVVIALLYKERVRAI